MYVYKHRQIGKLVLWVLGLTVLAIALVLIPVAPVAPRITTVVAVFLVLLAACMVIFGTLTVDVSQDRVELWFGPGLIRKRFPVEDILGAAAVRNRWYYGWGIRWTPHGWLFNVSGLDAVEIELRSGRTYRIGTDQPRELEAAILQVVEAA